VLRLLVEEAVEVLASDVREDTTRFALVTLGGTDHPPFTRLAPLTGA
jgi:hypothetical protein